MPDDKIEYFAPEELADNPFQYRPSMSPEALQELTDSVREHGILQPLLVRRTKHGPQVVAGMRRREAAKAAKLRRVPAIVRKLTDTQAAEVTLIENVQREDVSDYATAMGLVALQEMAAKEGKKLGVLELSQRLKMSHTWVRNRLKLVNLKPVLQEVAQTQSNVISSLLLIDGLRDEEAVEELADAVRGGASHSAIKERVEAIKAEERWLRESQAAPDPETQRRAAADARAGNTTSRGRQYTGPSQADARAQVERHLRGLDEWVSFLSEANYQRIVVPAAQRLLKRRK